MVNEDSATTWDSSRNGQIPLKYGNIKWGTQERAGCLIPTPAHGDSKNEIRQKNTGRRQGKIEYGKT